MADPHQSSITPVPPIQPQQNAHQYLPYLSPRPPPAPPPPKYRSPAVMTRGESISLARRAAATAKKRREEARAELERQGIREGVDAALAGIVGASASTRANVSQNKSKRQKRVKWSPQEVDALRAGVARYGEGRWAVILREFAASFNPVRISVDLKDKWRNLYKVSKTTDSSSITPIPTHNTTVTTPLPAVDVPPVRVGPYRDRRLDDDIARGAAMMAQGAAEMARLGRSQSYVKEHHPAHPAASRSDVVHHVQDDPHAAMQAQPLQHAPDLSHPTHPIPHHNQHDQHHPTVVQPVQPQHVLQTPHQLQPDPDHHLHSEQQLQVEQQLQTEQQLPTEQQLQAGQRLQGERQIHVQQQLQEDHRMHAEQHLQAEEQLQTEEQLQAEQLQAAQHLQTERELQGQQQLQPDQRLQADQQLQAEQQLRADHQLQAAQQLQADQHLQPEHLQSENQLQSEQRVQSEQPLEAEYRAPVDRTHQVPEENQLQPLQVEQQLQTEQQLQSEQHVLDGRAHNLDQEGQLQERDAVDAEPGTHGQPLVQTGEIDSSAGGLHHDEQMQQELPQEPLHEHPEEEPHEQHTEPLEEPAQPADDHIYREQQSTDNLPEQEIHRGQYHEENQAGIPVQQADDHGVRHSSENVPERHVHVQEQATVPLNVPQQDDVHLHDQQQAGVHMHSEGVQENHDAISGVHGVQYQITHQNPENNEEQVVHSTIPQHQTVRENAHAIANPTQFHGSDQHATVMTTEASPHDNHAMQYSDHPGSDMQTLAEQAVNAREHQQPSSGLQDPENAQESDVMRNEQGQYVPDNGGQAQYEASNDAEVAEQHGDDELSEDEQRFRTDAATHAYQEQAHQPEEPSSRADGLDDEAVDAEPETDERSADHDVAVITEVGENQLASGQSADVVREQELERDENAIKTDLDADPQPGNAVEDADMGATLLGLQSAGGRMNAELHADDVNDGSEPVTVQFIEVNDGEDTKKATEHNAEIVNKRPRCIVEPIDEGDTGDGAARTQLVEADEDEMGERGRKRVRNDEEGVQKSEMRVLAGESIGRIEEVAADSLKT